MCFRSLAIFTLTLACLLPSGVLTSSHAADQLVFNDTVPTNDLTGTLEAQVLFAQSQILPARPRPGDKQPHLTGLRKTLLIVRPLSADHSTALSVTVRNAQGDSLGALDLQSPDKLPTTAYSIENAPQGPLDFTPARGTVATVRDQRELTKLEDEKAAYLLGGLKRNAVVEIELADGRWVRNIYFPDPKTVDGGKSLNGKIVRVQSQAGYESSVFYSGRCATIGRGKNLQFKCVKDQWLQDSDLENNGIVYATDAWSGEMPADWIVPGISLEFRHGSLMGKLADLHIGAPTQLLIHTIDVGMLTTPRNEFAFANDPQAHREYFQTVPTSKLIVAQYAPLYLKEVMLPDGTLLTDADPGNGGWHEGTMRQHIGKELISHGIDNANYGLNCTEGKGEDSHPYVAAQLAAHNNRGKYANGIQVHGGSGGDGIVTLDNSIGNELSHEVGHNYGLGHYVDGFNGSVHRPADQNNSTWGWDADKNRFIPNFAVKRSGRDTCVEGQCQQPFDGRSYGLDAMAGGEPLSGMNRFTLYTPNTAAIIQAFLESKAIFDARSETGFRKWNPSTSRMDTYKHSVDGGTLRKPEKFGVPVVTLVGYYDPDGELTSYIYPALQGACGFCYPDDRSTLNEADCQLRVETKDGERRFRLANARLSRDGKVMNKFHINIPAASEPSKVSLIVGDRVLDEKPITLSSVPLQMTVNGIVVPKTRPTQTD